MFRVEGREGVRQAPAPCCAGCARTRSFTRTLSLFLPVQHNSRQMRDQLVPRCFACITSMTPFWTERSRFPTCFSVSAIWVWWECWWPGDLHPKVMRCLRGTSLGPGAPGKQRAAVGSVVSVFTAFPEEGWVSARGSSPRCHHQACSLWIVAESWVLC